MEPRGVLIVFDGIDGTGKSTQVRMLGDALSAAGSAVVCSREPTDGPWGRKIRESFTAGRMTLADELHAFIEDRKQHVAEVILPALACGEVVILDRYYHSTVAYQGARGADAWAIYDEMRQLFPAPDVTFILDLPPELALERIEQSRGETPNTFEQLEYLKAVREIFLEIARRDGAVRVVDAHRVADEVHAEVLGFVKKECNTKSAGPPDLRKPQSS